MPNQYTNDLQCSHCGLTREEFHKTHKPGKGLFSKHRNLCLGKDQFGNPLHYTECLICAKDLSSKTIEAVYSHYRTHSQDLTQTHTIHDIHREFCPHDYPDLDMNQHYGLLLTRQNVVDRNVDERIAGYWQNFIKVPATIYHDLRDIRDYYREAFSNFFGVDAISLHGHVSDVANPFLLTSIILHLKVVGSEKVIPDAFKLDRRALTSPQLAVMEGSYGTGFGPLAYFAPCPWSSSVACGPQPVVVKMVPAKIDQQIRTAKARRCVAFIVEIVRSSDGGVMTSDQWKATVEACKKHRIILIVDEALTAIRCGAPFAHQLPQYQHHGRPDFILFGKGVRTNGIAVDWHGINVHQLGQDTLEERLEAIIVWQKRFTESAPPEILLRSWGTIVLAQKQNWPQRAVHIGQTLRGILLSFHVEASSISGLHSLIWLRRSDRALNQLGVMSANAGEQYTRWLPLMDAVMTSEAEMKTKVFGLGSQPHRKQLAAFMTKRNWWHGYCSRCGDTMETGEDREGARERCMVCFARPCDICEPDIHVCPMGDKRNWTVGSTQVILHPPLPSGACNRNQQGRKVALDLSYI